jgi:hypothetical protein
VERAGGDPQGFVVTIEPTDRRNDSGLAADLLEQIERRCRASPERLLADTTAMTQEEIVAFAEHRPGLTVYSPPAKDHTDVSADSIRKRRWRREREPEVLRQWRERMASEAGKLVYRRRKLTEHAHAKMKNRGFGQMLVHGTAAVRVVCLLHALAHNLLHAHHMRAAIA